MAWQFTRNVFRPSDIPTGLVGYWKFNNDATDSSASGYDLTAVNSPTYTTDTYWKEGEKSTHLIKGSSQYFSTTVANAPNLNINGAAGVITFACWIKPNAAESSKLISNQTGSAGYDIFHDTNAANAIDIYLNNAHVLTTAAGTAPEGKWTHIVAQYDPVSNVANCFIDGNLSATATYSTDIATSAADIVFGYTGNNYFDGEMKDVAVWSVMLTPLQIKSLALGVDLSKYAYRPNNVSTQPTHWWRLNEVSGNRADSVTTNPLTLTDNNTVLSSGGYVEGVSGLFAVAATEYLSCADSDDFNFGSGNFSVRARVKFTDVGAVSREIWGQAQDGSNYARFRFNSNTFSYGGVTLGELGTWNFTPVAGVWYDIVMRRDGTTFTTWVDGVSLGDQTSATAITNLTGAWMIGGIAHGGTSSMNGNIEDVAVWKGYALTDAEIASLACALPVQRQGVVSYWKMNGADSATEVSSIGDATKNILTPTGGVCASATGKVGTSREMLATNTEILFCDTTDQSTDMTIAAGSDMSVLSWVYPVGAIAGDTKIASLGSGSYFHKAGSGTPYWTPNSSSANFSEPTADTWVHWSGVFDGSHSQAYTNSALTEDLASNAPDGTAVDIELGWFTVSTGSYANIRFDETIIAKRYFRPEEIKAIYLHGLNAKEAFTAERSAGNLSQVVWID